METRVDKRAPLLPPLNALRVLDALVRCGSLRAAAAELGVVPGAVRQQLAGLESHFGIALIERDAGRVKLTSAGQRLADATGVALSIIGRAAEEVSSGKGLHRLKLGIPMPMATDWFIPRLPRLLAETTSVEIDVIPISVRTTLSDMPELDAMIMGGEYRPLPDVAATSFMVDAFGPVTAPGPGENTSLDLLTAIIARDVPDLWDDWFRESGHSPVRFRKRSEVANLALAIGAAKAGLGVTIAPHATVASDLASGVLMAPQGFVVRSSGYRLCCRIADRETKPIAELRAWLVAEGARQPLAAGNLLL